MNLSDFLRQDHEGHHAAAEDGNGRKKARGSLRRELAAGNKLKKDLKGLEENAIGSPHKRQPPITPSSAFTGVHLRLSFFPSGLFAPIRVHSRFFLRLLCLFAAIPIYLAHVV